jgi:hypothetical protein
VPTVLIPSGGGYRSDPAGTAPDTVRLAELLRIEGFYYHYKRTGLCISPNTSAQVAPPAIPEPDYNDRKLTWSHDDNVCVRRGFACGTNIIVPPALAPCFVQAPGSPWAFLNSEACGGLPNSAPFFVALFRKPCPAGAKNCLNNWGFFEALVGTRGSGDANFADFQSHILSANPASLTPDPAAGEAPALGGTYVTWNGDRIEFDAAATMNDKHRPGVGKVNGTVIEDIDNWPRASGDVMSSKYCLSTMVPFYTQSHYEISGAGKGLTIDFCDVSHPQHSVH